MDMSMLPDFITESEEHLEEMETNLLQLEADSGNKEALNNIFRNAHSIKGNAEYLGVKKISKLSHKLENLLEILRKEIINIDSHIIELLIRVRDRMNLLVNELSHDKEEKADIEDLINNLDHYSNVIDEKEQTNSKPQNMGEEVIDDIFFDVTETQSRYAEPGRREEKLSHYEYYEQLKKKLYDITRGEVSDAGKQQVHDILDALIRESGDMKDVVKSLGDLKEQANTLSYPDDAGDMLAELKKMLHLTGAEECTLPGQGTTGMPDENQPDPELNLTAGAIQTDDDTYADETDEELFAIYIDHLKENLSYLRNVSLDLQNTDDYSGLFKICLGKIDSLKSSANYMDYKKIVKIYEKMSAEIEVFQENIFLQEDHDFKEFLETGIDSYIDSVIRFFPQCHDELVLETGKTEIVGKLNQDGHKQNDTTSSEPDVFHEISESSEPEDSSLGLSETKGGVIEEMTASAMDSQGLFEELDSMFDAPVEKPAMTYAELDDEPDLGDLEEELTGSSNIHYRNNPERENDEIIVKGDDDVVEQAEVPLEIKADLEDESSETQVTDAAACLPFDNDSHETSEDVLQAAPVSEDVIQAAPADSIEFEHGSDKQVFSNSFGNNVVKKSVRVDARKIDSLMNQAGELVVSRAGFSQLFTEMLEFQHEMHDSSAINSKDLKQLKRLIFRLNESIISLGRVANELQDGVMKVRMLPISQLFNRYPRLVRDLTHGTQKNVVLKLSGEDTELDKMVIEAIADPLVHIIRNAIDHGAETVDERLKAGKSDVCTLKLESYHESNHVVIEIIDDGCGIDPDHIKTVANQKGIVSHDELSRMNEKDITALIMMPGFSTSSMITKTSGRGVGMDVVKKNIEKLNGTIEIDSSKNLGTRIRIKIPLTLAIIKALLVKVGMEVFTIPLATVEETLQIYQDDFSFIEGVEVIKLRDNVLSLLRLSDLFNIATDSSRSGKVYVVVVNTGMRQVGLVVDELIGQEETVIKPLVDYLQENSGFSGATILGDGSISLILDVYELIAISMGSKTANRKVPFVNENVRQDMVDRFAAGENHEGRTVH